ncbi:MAG: hypothetical protein VCB07_01285, partial [Gammaproteobacteria bacterium]
TATKTPASNISIDLVMLETVSKMDGSALPPETGRFKFSWDKMPCAGVSAPIPKRANVASADLRA